MDTNEIIKALKNEPGFVGCFARDRLPRKTKRPAGLVVNSDKSSSRGTHWMAYFIDAGGNSEFFDPLGNSIPNNEILRFVRRNGCEGWPSVTWNSIPFQADTSWKCGAFCIHYLKNRLRGKSLCEIFATLSHNPEVNDAVV